MYYDTANVAGPSTCRRCPHTEPGVQWDRVPRMPDVKPAREMCQSCARGFNGTKGNGYQPCGCNNA